MTLIAEYAKEKAEAGDAWYVWDEDPHAVALGLVAMVNNEEQARAIHAMTIRDAAEAGHLYGGYVIRYGDHTAFAEALDTFEF